MAPLSIKRRLLHRRAFISLVFVVAFLILILGGGGYVGLFSTVELARETAGPYTVVGIDHYGSFRRIYGVLDQQAVPLLQDPAVRLPEGAFRQGALVDDRFGKIPKPERHAVIGYVYDGHLEVKVEPPLKVVHVPSRETISAKLNAHRSVAAFKAYRKLREVWQSRLEQSASHWGSPSLEIYEADDHLLVQMPVEAD